jgi:hypothetical protein
VTETPEREKREWSCSENCRICFMERCVETLAVRFVYYLPAYQFYYSVFSFKKTICNFLRNMLYYEDLFFTDKMVAIMLKTRFVFLTDSRKIG